MQVNGTNFYLAELANRLFDVWVLRNIEAQIFLTTSNSMNSCTNNQEKCPWIQHIDELVVRAPMRCRTMYNDLYLFHALGVYLKVAVKVLANSLCLASLSAFSVSLDFLSCSANFDLLLSSFRSFLAALSSSRVDEL